MKNLVKFSCFWIFLFVGSSKVWAQAGKLDLSYGNGGIAITTQGPDVFSQISSIAIQSDGMVVAAGSCYNSIVGKYYINVLRFKINGTLDSTFGIGGIVTDSIGLSDDNEASCIAIQPDGKIVVGGFAFISTDFDFVLLRFNTNGTPDSTFGTYGIITKNLGDDNFANSIALQADGKILLCGSTSNGVDQDFAVVRFNNDGSTDANYAAAGMALVSMTPASEDIPTHIKIQPDGKAIIVGLSANTTTYIPKVALLRLDTNGFPDISFGNSGKVVNAFSANGDQLTSVVLQPDGKLVVVGQAVNTNAEILVARYTSTGILDNTFGNGGYKFYNFSNQAEQAYSVAIQADGKIVVAGSVDSLSTDIALIRVRNNGVIDSTFGTNGKVATELSTGYDYATSMLLQADGKIVLGGMATQDFAMMRYQGDPLDAALSNLTIPSSRCGAMGNNQTVSVLLSNNGNTKISLDSIKVQLQITGANNYTIIKNNTIVLPFGASQLISFTNINLPNLGTNFFNISIQLNGDSNLSNNILTASDTAFGLKPTVNFSSTNSNNTYAFTPSINGRNPITYQWNFGDGSATSSLPNPSHHYPYTNTYSVKLIVTDACGTDSISKSITITTGINQTTENTGFQITPNPANGLVLIRTLNSNEILPIALYDMQGKLCMSFTTDNEGTARIDLSNYAEGVYFIQCQAQVHKICVVH